jgi:hypothetical protein
MAGFRSLGEMLFAGQSHQIFELADEHAAILPQIGLTLPRYVTTH